jgi:hypothetical protein
MLKKVKNISGIFDVRSLFGIGSLLGKYVIVVAYLSVKTRPAPAVLTLRAGPWAGMAEDRTFLAQAAAAGLRPRLLAATPDSMVEVYLLGGGASVAEQ